MRSFLIYLRRLFSRRPDKQPAHVSSPSLFPELDIEGFKSQLALEEEGRTRGVRDNPASDSDHLDDIEQTIARYADKEKQAAIKAFKEHLDTYAERINEAEARFNDTDGLNSPVDRAETRLKTALNRSLDELVQLKNKAQEREDEVKKFQVDHGLDRLPNLPESLYLQWGIILVVLIAESILNGNFLSLGHELGLLGGIIEALVIAGINVSAGFSFGRWGAPQWNHLRRYRKVLGRLALLAYVVVVLGFNWGVAHYRTALGSDTPENAARLAFETLTAPSLVADMQSWFLFLLGIVFSVIAACDGWTMDDPYPGYGTVARSRDKAGNDFSDQRESLLDDLEKIRDEGIQEVDNAADSIRKNRAEYRDAIQGRGRLEELFLAHLDSIEKTVNELLHTYRDANIRARKTSPPDHFAQKWSLDRSNCQNHRANGRDLDEIKERMKEGMKYVDTKQGENRKKIIAKYTESIDECTKRLEGG